MSGEAKISRRNYLKYAGAVVAVAVVAGAGYYVYEATKPPEKVTLSYLDYLNPPHNKVHKEQVDNYMKLNPNVTINYNIEPYPEIGDKIIASFEAGNPADIVTCVSWWMANLVEPKRLDPAPDSMVKKIEDKFVSGTKDLCTQADGVVYGPTHEFGIHIPIFNLDMLEKYNLKPPTTWEELVEIDKQMTTVEGGMTKQAGFAFFPKGGWIAISWVGVLYAYGEKVLSNDMKSFAANTERGIKSLETFVSLCHPDLCPDEFATHEAFTKQLIAGEDFISLTRTYVKEGPFPNMRFMAYGPLSQYEKKTQSYTWFFVVPKALSAEKKKAAWSVIDYATDPKQDEMMGDIGYIPMLKESWDLPKFKEDTFLKAFADSVPYTKLYPGTSKWPAIESVIVAQAGRAIAKEITPEQALKAMEEQINPIVA